MHKNGSSSDRSVSYDEYEGELASGPSRLLYIADYSWIDGELVRGLLPTVLSGVPSLYAYSSESSRISSELSV
jgi:hypothetical protein